MSLPLSMDVKPAAVRATSGEELIRRCLEQDPRAQREFFDAHYGMVLGITSR
jgi:hypothetical protein